MNLDNYNPNPPFFSKTPPGDVKVDVLLRNRTIWLPQKKIAVLFGVNVPPVSKHLNNIFESGELEKRVTVSILETVRTEGKREVKRNLEIYNLNAVIAVGYRVNSNRATQFRIWKNTDQWKKFQQNQLFESDFDKMLKKTIGRRCQLNHYIPMTIF